MTTPGSFLTSYQYFAVISSNLELLIIFFASTFVEV
jgi:hypothetical protein